MFRCLVPVGTSRITGTLGPQSTWTSLNRPLRASPEFGGTRVEGVGPSSMFTEYDYHPRNSMEFPQNIIDPAFLATLFCYSPFVPQESLLRS